MEGSTVAQFMFDGYLGVARQGTETVVNNILPIVSASTIVLLHLFVVIWGVNYAHGRMDSGEFANRFVRGYIVIALMVPATFNSVVTQSLTVEIPGIIQRAVGGQQNMNGAQGFDALLAKETLMAAKIRKQAIPALWHMPERAAIWAIEMVAKAFIFVSFLIFFVATVTVYFCVPFLALLGWTYLFRATQHFCEAAISMIVSLLLVQAGALMVSAVVVVESGAYLERYGNLIMAKEANAGLQMPTDDGTVARLAFTGFGDLPAGAQNAGFAGTAADPTANIDSSIEILGNTALVFLVGAFLMGLTTSVAWSIGRYGGFSASGVINNTIGRVASGAARMAARR